MSPTTKIKLFEGIQKGDGRTVPLYHNKDWTA